MANVTQRLTAREYLSQLASKAPPKRRNKFGNKRSITESGEKYDSTKEVVHHQALEASRCAKSDDQRVVEVRRQVKFELLPKQDGERAVNYFADFVVLYADGHTEVHDTKSVPTRKDKTYVLKRKLMLAVHNIRIIEI